MSLLFVLILLYSQSIIFIDQNFTNPPTNSDTDVRLHSMEGFDVEKGETWQYPIDFPLRDYQFSIVRRCLFTNTLVCLPTGLGKTFIAAVVMLNFYRWYPDGKIVFMAPTKPLVNQQVSTYVHQLYSCYLFE